MDDDEDPRLALVQALRLAGYEVLGFEFAHQALEHAGFGFNGIVVADIRMPGMDGMSLLQRIHEIDPDLPVILVTGHGDVQLAVRAIQEGAYDFAEKPLSVAALTAVVARALKWRGLVLENRRLREAGRSTGDDLELRLVGRSQKMVDHRYKIRAIAPTDADVLIIGETGTGKEVTARAIHDFSARAAKPFVAINCAAMPANLIESELFGHEAGAFAGAVRARCGKFEHARGGTILLDELGSMPLDVQAKLLRVVQERQITRLGSNELIELDVRFIATSKTDLEAEVAQGRFRADLLYRLNAVTLRTSPLRERRTDIPLLFLHLVDQAARRYRRSGVDVLPHVTADITDRDWPGNVRELRNAAERHLLGLGWIDDEAGDREQAGTTLSERMGRFERNTICALLAAHPEGLKPVYESLGISRKTLYEKMRRYGLHSHEQGQEE